MLERKVFVGKGGAVDALAAGAVAAREVAALAHELRDDAVEGAALEVQALARPPRALFAGAERAKVFGRARHHIGAQLHDHAARQLARYLDVKVDARVLHLIAVPQQQQPSS